MLKHNSDFEQIKPYGNLGDGGNDGRIKKDHTYFQVYAPKVMSNSAQNTDTAIREAVKKCTEDFEKLKANWPDIKKYYFVYNDRFSGTPAPVAKELDLLQDTYNLEVAKTFNSDDLFSLFKQLPLCEKEELVGYIASPKDITLKDPGAVGQLLQELANQDNDLSFNLELEEMRLVEYENKIQLNGLSDNIKTRLNYSIMSTNIIEDFFSESSGTSSIVGRNIANIYLQAKNEIPDCEKSKPDLIYMDLIEKIVNDTIYTKCPITKKAYKIAAEAIIAYYFENCDIYERN